MPIFQPYRALGYITDTTPFSVQRRGRETFVTVSVGKAWQLYNVISSFRAGIVPQLTQSGCGVMAVCKAFAGVRRPPAEENNTRVGFMAGLHLCGKRTSDHSVQSALSATWCGHTDKVLLLLQFGEHIISVGADHRMLIWNATSLGDEVQAEGEILLSSTFTPTCIVHPDTYLNKVLLGSQEGQLQLWNVSSKQLIYEFKGWGSAVMCCAPSPALDTVAVGMADGRVHLHNLKFDETVMSLLHSSKGPVTALSFRTDGQPLLAAGGTTGMISIWNLEKRKLQTVVKDGHDGPVVALHFLAREPVLLSSGADNSLKMWIFDTEDGEARLLRFRNGHSSPPSCVKYYGNGRHILCAGQDRSFRVFSTIQDQQSRELSQGHLAKRAKKLNLREEELKLSRVVAFAAAEIRERDWCNVVTCHEGDSAAYTWQLSKFVIGEHLLTPPGGDLAPIRACEISACGNFALIGSANGRVDRFNLQSGIHRRSYSPIRQQYSSAHEGAVIGLHTDATNTIVITAGYDGFIKVWEFKKGGLKSTLNARSPLVKTAYHRVNGLLVVASDDLIIRVYDVTAARLVRKFEGHTDRITDMHVSADGRWLLTSAMDRCVRTWDLVQSRLLDCMECEVAVTGLSLAPGMDMLATIHVNRNGIYLWANKLMYSGLEDADILPRGTPLSAAVPMPTVSSGSKVAEGEVAEVDPVSVLPTNGREKEGGGVAEVVGEGSGQLLPDLVTLAMLPRSQWQNLINLDIIKARNKPIAPPKKPELAPFFLPTLPSLSGEMVFAPRSNSGEEEVEVVVGGSRVKRQTGIVESKSEFSRLMHEGAKKNDFLSLRQYLRGLSPSAIDLELSMMEILEDEGDVQEEDLVELELLLHFLTVETAAKRDFEFLQAILHRVLAIHGELIAQEPRLQDKATALLKEQHAAWQKLDDLFQSVRCTVGFLSNSQ